MSGEKGGLTAEERGQLGAAIMDQWPGDPAAAVTIMHVIRPVVERILADRDAPSLDVRLLLAKYAGRSAWIGYERPRREAWAEIERDLRAVLQANPRKGA